MTVKMILPGTRLNDCPTAWQNFVKSFRRRLNDDPISDEDKDFQKVLAEYNITTKFCDSHPNEDDYVTFASEEDYLAFMLTWG